jgi:hypothetical protein
MKKTLIYILAIAVLALTAWWLIEKNKRNSSIQELEVQYDFTIPDTAAITRIEISDKLPSQVHLTRTEKGWLVNGQYPARPDAIEVLLETFNRMTMRSFVPEPTQKTIISRLAVYGKEVKVYAGDELIKHFFVGTETPDQLGTYMMLNGAEQPFAVHIQGFNGYLNSRFFTEEELWRDRTLFGLEVNDIAEVSMMYQEEGAISPTESFTIKLENGQAYLYDINNMPITDARAINLNIFLGSFRTAKYEALIVPSDGIYNRKDSLQASNPVFVMTLKDKAGNAHKLRAHHKRPDDKEEVGEDGLPLQWDPDRMYAFTGDGRWVLIQYYGLRNIIVTKDFFRLDLDMDN